MRPPGTVEHALALMEQLAQKNASLERARREPIAIVGMGCRFPGGARDPASFWKLLQEGRDAVVPLDRRWEWLRVPPPEAPGWAGLLPEEEVEQFDAAFFEISDREARSMDPQQRLVLTVAWEALENAGISPRSLAASATGVFVGSTGSEYQRFGERQPPDQRDAYFATGMMLSSLAGRLSYVLGLQGPAVTLDTACSSSLVATHLACQSLRSQESHLALAAGVNLILSPEVMSGLALTRTLSPDGRCRTFDAGANGYVRGEGCGVVVLKRLSDAQRDGDRIWAIIRGSAVNQDGRSTGLAAPNMLAQQRLLREALSAARVDPSQLDYVETHGTGTQLGDPIELEALKAVLGAPRQDGSRCLLGALKTNVGHLEAAAGVAGLMKAALVLHHRTAPRNLHFQKLNPLIQLEGSTLAVAAKATPLPLTGQPLRAGLSSFGITGTNAHAVLEEPPKVMRGDVTVPPHALPLLLSARTPEALSALAERLRTHLADHPELSLLDMAHTLAVARPRFEERAELAVRDEVSALRGLGDVLSRRSTVRSPRDVAVELIGAGPPVRAVRELHQRCEVFRESLNATAKHLGVDPEQVLEGRDGPAQLALHVALFRLCESWGLRIGALLGAGAGEIAAAHLAGALSLEDACRVAGSRGLPVNVGPAATPSLLLVSSVTAARVGPESLGDPEHWVRVVRTPGRPAEARRVLEAEGFALSLELGPDIAGVDSLIEAIVSIHSRGAAVDWTAFFSRLGGRRVELPSYPFQGRRHWLPAEPLAAKRGPHPVLFDRLVSAETGSTIWSGALEDGVPIGPSAAALDLMAFVFARESGTSALELEQLVIEQPLVPAREIQVVLKGEDLALYARSGGGAWALHAKARARPGSRRVETISAEAEQAKLLHAPGADGFAKASLVLEDCAQVLAGLAPSSAPMVARRIKRCRVHAPIRGERFWCRARLGGDVSLYDEGGNLLVEIEGLELEQAAAVEPAPAVDVVSVLAANLKQLLGRSEEIDPDESLLVLGLDSLMAYDAQQFIETRWKVEVPVKQLLAGASLNEIAGLIRDATGK